MIQAIGVFSRAKCAALGILIAVLPIALRAQIYESNSVVVTWKPSPDPNVTGYWVYFGWEPHRYLYSTFVGNTTNTFMEGLTPGHTYYFAITATEDSGLESEFSNETSYTVPPYYSPDWGVSVVVKGRGTVVPDLNQQTLVPGTNYTITAVPDLGYHFAGWSGSTNSTEPTLTFFFDRDLSFEADFERGPPLPGGVSAGSYHGLFRESGQARPRSAGGFELVVTTRGTYSGRLQLGPERLAFKGAFGSTGRATNQITPRFSPGLALEMYFDDRVRGDEVFGRITDGVFVSDLVADRAIPKTTSSAYAGAYTLVIRGSDSDPSLPPGAGYGAIRVNPRGVAAFSGTLADGTRLTLSSPVSSQGSWAFFASLYGGQGLVINRLTFSTLDSSPVGGIDWVKPSNPSARYFSGGFVMHCDTAGSVYRRPLSRGVRVLAMVDGSLVIPGLITNPITLGPSGRVTSSDPGLKLSINPRTGVFRGTIADAQGGRPLPLGGVVCQSSNTAYGVLLGPDRTALVVLSP